MATVSHSLLPALRLPPEPSRSIETPASPELVLQTYPWTSTAETLLEFRQHAPAIIERSGIAGARLLGTPLDVMDPVEAEWLFAPPPVLRPQLEGVEASASAWQDVVDRRQAPGVQGVLLYEAGAACLGVWVDGELVDHKAFRRYVVRGNGKAQSLHLKTKGRSRYGSRLRLQNAARLEAEVLERLLEWDAAHGPLDCLWRGVGVRLFATLAHAWSKSLNGRLEDPCWCRPLPCAVRTARFEELRRCWGFLAHGAWRGPAH